MIIFYDKKTQQWFTSVQNENLTFGSNHYSIPYKNLSDQQKISFEVFNKNGNLGPIIGILTSRKKDRTIAGNKEYFQDLQMKIINKKGIPLLFTQDDILMENVNGYLYLHDEKRWIQITAPLPHVVYNRVPFRKSEKTLEFHDTKQFFYERNIPFFNPGFINKYELYTMLKKHSILKNFVPKTYLIQHKHELKQLLKEHIHLYLKPVEGSLGKGIYLISFNKDDSIHLKSVRNEQTFQNYDEFWDFFQQKLMLVSYIAQEKIIPATIGHYRYDFRIHILYELEKYVLTDVGIRQSALEEITTHIPNGGTIIPYTSIQTEEHDAFIRTLVDHCGDLLSNEKGFFGELSIDAGLGQNGNYYIYEINSKPMKFDEASIETKRKEQLIKLFFSLW